ncbi:GNAT family N-acetyltransferase [Glycomyces sp. A-F 0318]|uniref:GNAT family N-acetyltransferase n=1 Tax=Glycomyces amatae TaxID=2881355 RepID=UPI001E28ACA4|nr:GNAT family N-acetyltransferase [Glycomyces amatae]MCD0445443.1 GNAT family N-acetyltransferase [Glycomyces amatae]
MTADTPYAPVWRVGPASSDVVIDVLTDAFQDDPFTRWVFPEPSGRIGLQAGFYRALLGHPGAEAHLFGDAAAIWLDLGSGERLHGEPGPADVEDPGLARLNAVGEALARRHPVDAPHLYLAAMGVAAARQGGGLGAALLRHRLDQADRDGVGAYLEAGSPRSRAFYLRHGFADLGEPVRLRGAPPLYPMWRPAAPSVHNR